MANGHQNRPARADIIAAAAFGHPSGSGVRLRAPPPAPSRRFRPHRRVGSSLQVRCAPSSPPAPALHSHSDLPVDSCVCAAAGINGPITSTVSAAVSAATTAVSASQAATNAVAACCRRCRRQAEIGASPSRTRCWQRGTCVGARSRRLRLERATARLRPPPPCHRTLALRASRALSPGPSESRISRPHAHRSLN